MSRKSSTLDVEPTSTVTVVQTTIPDYRTRFFELLGETLGSRLTLMSGEHDWSHDVRHAGGVRHVTVRNVFFARRNLLWQPGTLRPLVSADVAVLDLNPRIVSAWVALIARRLAGRRTVLWGHAWPRRGEESWTDRIRAAMRRLAGAVIVYTETEARELRRRYPGLDVVAAPNALYERGELRPATTSIVPTDLVYVGRLSRSKRVDVLLEAFRSVEDDLPAEVRLVVVGEGALRPALEARAAGSARIVFTGHVSAVDELRELYGRAIASVSAGEVGLSVVQSLGFGVPMILARSERHGPEIEATADANSVSFAPATAGALGAAMIDVVRDRERWLERRAAIAEDARDRYSLERMVDAFLLGLGGSRERPGT